jgi:DNA-binding transcriptional ArsR family regulator
MKKLNSDFMNKSALGHTIRAKKQLAVLRSAVRQEIVDVMVEMGAVSVAELAATLDRPPDALYFHLRALKAAELVRSAGYRSRQGRKEELFETISREFFLEYRHRSRAIGSIVGSMLRLGTRDFCRALNATAVTLHGPHRELWALRKTGRLAAAQLARVNDSIERLKGTMNSQRKGRLYAITVLLTPVDRRRQGKAQRRGYA